MQQYLQNKKGLVQGVFDQVFDKYDLMNDFMSLGVHRIWIKNLNKVLSEAYRVLKPGGRFLCLEFSKIQNENFEYIYKQYSKLIPLVGKYIVGKKEPYEYLIKSIEEFVNQDELLELMVSNNFKKCNYRNLTNGVVSIHSGWKI